MTTRYVIQTGLKLDLCILSALVSRVAVATGSHRNIHKVWGCLF